eukprot:403374006
MSQSNNQQDECGETYALNIKQGQENQHQNLLISMILSTQHQETIGQGYQQIDGEVSQQKQNEAESSQYKLGHQATIKKYQTKALRFQKIFYVISNQSFWSFPNKYPKRGRHNTYLKNSINEFGKNNSNLTFDSDYTQSSKTHSSITTKQSKNKERRRSEERRFIKVRRPQIYCKLPNITPTGLEIKLLNYHNSPISKRAKYINGFGTGKQSHKLNDNLQHDRKKCLLWGNF